MPKLYKLLLLLASLIPSKFVFAKISNRIHSIAANQDFSQVETTPTLNRSLIFPKGVYEVHYDEALERFLSHGLDEGIGELTEDQFSNLVDLYIKKGLITIEDNVILSQVTSFWGK